ncbi:MAG: EAL domain-containing protein [Pseudomonadota bacterium]
MLTSLELPQAICIAQLQPTNTNEGADIPTPIMRSLLQDFDASLPSGDCVEELSRGRFGFALNELKGVNHAKLAAAKFQRITQAVTDSRYELHTGIAFRNEEDAEPESIRIRADIACKEAVRAQQESVFADDALVQAHTTALQLGEDISSAITHHNLLLFYQPQVDEEGCIAACEGLLRWQKEKLISPGHFLPRLKQTELYQVTRYTARQVIRDLADQIWIPSSSLNIDPAILDNALLQLILDELELWQVNTNRLTIEITEAGLINNYDQTIELLAKARDLGLSVAIDDFGTGYSSLQHFKNLPIDELKIDMIFVQNLRTDQSNQYLCNMMIDLAHTFGHQVVAEGVEDEWSAEWLFNAGCDLLQGFYYSPPLPLESLNHMSHDE